MDVVEVILKHETQTTETIIRGEKINIIGASKVKHLITKTKSQNPKTFKIEAENTNFKAKIPLPREIKEALLGSRKTKQAVKMKGTQFPVISNNATTVWKL